jgi:hypothetical protein
MRFVFLVVLAGAGGRNCGRFILSRDARFFFGADIRFQWAQSNASSSRDMANSFLLLIVVRAWRRRGGTHKTWAGRRFASFAG